MEGYITMALSVVRIALAIAAGRDDPGDVRRLVGSPEPDHYVAGGEMRVLLRIFPLLETSLAAPLKILLPPPPGEEAGTLA